MKSKRLSITVLTCVIACCATTAFAQQDDSIENSWNRAANQKQQETQQQTQAQDDAYKWADPRNPAPQPGQPVVTKSRSFPTLPDNPAAKDYFNVNTALLDSLTNMYCVSGAYLRSLRMKNEAAFAQVPQSAPPAQKIKKDKDGKFNYEKDSWRDNKENKDVAPPLPPNGNTETLHGLHTELDQLLDKCLNR